LCVLFFPGLELLTCIKIENLYVQNVIEFHISQVINQDLLFLFANANQVILESKMSH